MNRRSSSTARGFTLLEVLGAVAVVGLVFTVLATGAIRSLRAEGVNQRRMRAALLADQTLFDIETGLASGAFPELGETETESEEFLIRTEILPWDAYLEAQSDALPDGVALTDDAVSNGLALVTRDAPGLVEMLATVRITVSWIEGVDEYSVVRTTFALDRESALAAFPIEGAGGAVADEGEPPEEENPLDAFAREQGL